MTKPEPLKLIRLDKVYFHLHKSTRIGLEEDIKSAIDWLIKELPDNINKSGCIILIKDAFPDITNPQTARNPKAEPIKHKGGK